MAWEGTKNYRVSNDIKRHEITRLNEKISSLRRENIKLKLELKEVKENFKVVLEK